MMMMRQQLVLLLVALLATVTVVADVYLHIPRGSNNRLDEANRGRNNNNRMFDSQNNNRGGYNVGSVYYTQGSTLPIEFTNQHSCGNANNNCNIVIEYSCNALVKNADSGAWEVEAVSKIRDGTTTHTIPENRRDCQNFDCDTDVRFGRHESYDMYQDCKYRERNYGLFTASQDLRNGRESAARYTRQNPNGNRRGYECPEERDYYPYWGPTMWHSSAILTTQPQKCAEYVAATQNTADRWYCVVPPAYFDSVMKNPNQYNNAMYGRNGDDTGRCANSASGRNMGDWCWPSLVPIDQVNCEKILWDKTTGKMATLAQREWYFTEVMKKATTAPVPTAIPGNIASTTAAGAATVAVPTTTAVPTTVDPSMKLDSYVAGEWAKFDAWASEPPVCRQSPWTRDNHLGNAMGESGQPALFNWTVPADFSSEQCTVRLRYNISTMEYGGFESDGNRAASGAASLSIQSGVDMAGNRQAAMVFNVTTWARVADTQRMCYAMAGRSCDEQGYDNMAQADAAMYCAGGLPDGLTSTTQQVCATRKYPVLKRGANQNPANLVALADKYGLDGEQAYVDQFYQSGNNLAPFSRRSNNNYVGEATRNGVELPAREAIGRDYVLKNNPRPAIWGKPICWPKSTAADGADCSADSGADEGAIQFDDKTSCANAAQLTGTGPFCGFTLRMQLAVNTAQFGRTFQDRSHTLGIRARPEGVTADDRIHNVEVRGKRGNIVQTFPGVEYDFAPNILNMREGDYVHFQWTGSNTNPNNNDGQGKRGTDRSNIVALRSANYREEGAATGCDNSIVNKQLTWAFLSTCAGNMGNFTAATIRAQYPASSSLSVDCRETYVKIMQANCWAAADSTLGAAVAEWFPASGNIQEIKQCGERYPDKCWPPLVTLPWTQTAFKMNFVEALPAAVRAGLVTEAQNAVRFEGQWGNSYPAFVTPTPASRADEAFRYVNFLGLSQNDLDRLALNRNDEESYGGENSELDDVSTSFSLGLRKITRLGEYVYLCTRNNNFSNRSQKGKIVVSPAAIEVNEIDANGGQIEMVFARLMVPAGVVPLGQLETVSIMAMPPMDGQRSGASEMIVVSGLTMEEGSEGAWLTIPFESKAMYSPSVSMSKDKGETWTTVGSTSFSGSEAKVNIRESGTYQVNNSLNVGIIIGIVLGGLAFLAIIFGLVYYKKNNNTCPVWRKMRGGASEPKFQRSHTEKKKTTKKPKKKSIKKPLNTFEPVEFPSAEESPIPVGNMAGKRAMFEQLDRDAQQV